MPRNRHGNYRVGATAVLVVLVFIAASGLPAMGQASVTTYHYDTYRTGWNRNESVLTPANVGTSAFGLLQNLKLDDQVDAQPLVMPGVKITAGNYQGTHDVVYVATENNTVYAIDVHTGSILLSPNFGTPVSYPLGCNNNGPNVGINSTPVIDPSSSTLYVMVYTSDATGPAYRLHALDLGSLSDKVAPQVVSASHTLANGTTFNFNATYQRQRPGLLLANGGVYAGFGSFCDFSANQSRGWLLGWTAGSLEPFPSNRLNDQQATSPNEFFLSSVWMSGYGPAADDAGNILFVTGNSDPSGTTYDGVTNIQESVVKVSSTLATVVNLFTPDNQASLDQADEDFGSGGVLVLPDQPGATPHLAVAAGKDGNMYFMNEDVLGGYSATQNNVLGTYQVGGCWCGESYYVDPTDGLGRVVSSGGNTVKVWKVQTSPTAALTNVTNASVSSSVQDPGFFTSISSNGTAGPIIWALSRPATTSNGAPISLYAFNPESGGSTMTQLFQATAGAWPNTSGNANLVPVVANGLVFVASHQQLQIFGLTGQAAATPTFNPAPGSYTSTQSVTLSDTTAGAVIYYTTDGTTPTTSSTVYSASKPIQVSATTTIKAIAVANSYANSAAASGTYTILAGGNTAVSLSGYYNVYGIATVGTAPKSLGFDNESYAYNSSLLGTSLTYQGIAFTLGPANALDAVDSQTVSFPAGSYPQLYLLGAAVNGNQTNQSVVVTYTDGSTSTFTQNFSDWFTGPAGYAGESTVIQMAGRISPSGGTQSAAIYVYGYTLTLAAGKAAVSVKLPSNRNVVFLAVGLNGTAQPMAATPTFSPAPGTYNSTQPVTISDTTPGATIYYTTNATTPTTNSSVYSTSMPIEVNATTTIETIAVANGYINSAVATGIYTIATSTAITPYIQVNGGSWQQTSAVTVAYGSSVNLGPQPLTGGSWSWTGPNGYTSTSRQINSIPLGTGTNTYAATYTNTSGSKSTQTFTITVTLAPTPIVPYVQVNNGSWQQTASVTVAHGSTVNLGPQPLTGGSWSWTGPNGYTSTSRQINSIPLSTGPNTYVATYTNTSGVKSAQTFTITVN